MHHYKLYNIMKKIIYLVPALSLAGCTSQQVEEKPNAAQFGGDLGMYQGRRIVHSQRDALRVVCDLFGRMAHEVDEVELLP